MTPDAGGRRAGLAARLTVLLAVVAATGTAVMGVYVSRALEAQAVERLEAALLTEARLLQEAVAPVLDGTAGAPEGQRRVQRYAALAGARLTVIDADGRRRPARAARDHGQEARG